MGFAVANRQWTSLSFDPISDVPKFSLGLPLWLLLFAGIFIGIIVGWFACWRAQSKWRKLARERGQEVSKLQGELRLAKEIPQKFDTQILTPLPGIMP
jgi:hypothetical protein